MSKRVSQTILLCEDEAHERFIKAFMKRCGLRTDPPYVKSLVASRMQHGGNDHWILNAFPVQLHACRQRQKKAETLLIVALDADDHTLEERRRQLLDRVTAAGYDAFAANERAILLIPKRSVETWIRALRGEQVTEDQDCKAWTKATKEEIRSAAQTLYEWSRLNANPGPTCVPSLTAALPEWRKIG
jgi:uncharacterized protein YdiU (UPF0061 family)